MIVLMLWSDVNAIYQIYPRSFFDESGNGVGDLRGITRKLGYIKGDTGAIGVDAIWISPFFTSPMADFGYDVADYCDVDETFGTLADFDELIAEAHRRDIKVMIDYVPNHSSDQHEWFKQSRSSRDNPKRDWYIWHDPKPDGSAPNNWLSVFGGSAWQYDEATGQYYLHSFLAEQPDLNWANPEVAQAMTDVLRFWLDRGVDGIRADAVRWMAKDLGFKDNPENPDYIPGDHDPYHSQLHRYSRYGDQLFSYLRMMTDTIAEYHDRIILFEDYPDTTLDEDTYSQYKAYYAVNPQVAAPFNFDGLHIEYSPNKFRELIDGFQAIMGSELRPFYCFGNHDKPRLVSRVGWNQARLIGLMQLTLPGIPVIYYGEEIGMSNVDIPTDKIQDPFEIQTPNMGLGRDPNRTPMQWDASLNAGFTKGEPWLPVAGDYQSINVFSQQQTNHSMLRLYQSLLGLRRSKILREGRYIEWHSQHSELFGYIRELDGERILVVLNMSDQQIVWQDRFEGEVIYSTHPAVFNDKEDTILMDHQGLVVRLRA